MFSYDVISQMRNYIINMYTFYYFVYYIHIIIRIYNTQWTVDSGHWTVDSGQ